MNKIIQAGGDCHVELEAMIDSIEAVKGKRYAAMVRYAFNSTNFNNLQTQLLLDTGGKEVAAFVANIEKDMHIDLLLTFAKLYVGSNDYDIDSAKAFITEFGKDLVMLMKKQHEYTSTGKGIAK